MSGLYFDHLNVFIKKRHRWIIAIWVVVAIACLTVIPMFFSSVSYNITGAFGGPSNSESQKAASILNAAFPLSSNESANTILVVLQGAQVYSDSLKNAVLGLNHTVAADKNISNFTGESSIYTVEYSLVAESVPSLVPQVASLRQEISSANTNLHLLEQNLSSLNSGLFQLQSGINQTAQLVFGVPAVFVQTWQGITAQGITDPYIANAEANATVLNVTSSFGGNTQSLGYYSVFLPIWNSTFQSLPNDTSVVDREALAINQSITTFLNSGGVDQQTAQIITLVSSGLSVINWAQEDALSNLTVSATAANIRPEVTTALGVTPIALASQLYALGPSPSADALENCTISLSQNSFNGTSDSSSFSSSQFLQATYDLGPSPSSAQTWNLASTYVAEGAQTVFSGSPLFTVNETSLAFLLTSLPENATAADVTNASISLVSMQSYQNYPYVPSISLRKNFVSQDDTTMIVVFDFSSPPDAGTIAHLKSDVQGSALASLGTIYVTGGYVVTHDVENVFSPALTLTIGPGIIVSLLIVGLLFLSPVAALLPVLMGGISTEVSLALIYAAIVRAGHGSITFLTPTLTVLLTLGLSVDYAVLQLRRTREERRSGKSVEESVGTSVKWAGQAVLTAGVTVIVAYIVMALANVPIFSSVATSIALSVTVLLAVTLTLVPSLEIALGDRTFWPTLQRSERKRGVSRNRLITLAKNVLKRKVPIVVIISLVALTGFYIEFKTPTGLDFLRLIPNFQSNQGLTVVTNSFGTGTLSPIQIIVTTPTAIVYGNSLFNQTLLDQIERICAVAANSQGVTSVSSTTRPFGYTFNYSTIETMTEPLMLQYEQSMYSTIGDDNKTTLISVGLPNSSESPAAVSSLQKLETNINKVPLISGVNVYYGGSTQSIYDSESFIASLLPEVVAVLSAAVYVILFIQLKSAFTPIRLIFTILCSVVLALALLSIVFYTWLGLPILDFAPLFVVVTMLGVGIDYDIFFVTRIREETLKGKSDNEAIETALDKVWTTIVGLGLVLATVFGSLLITGIAILQEISLTVTVAILLDVLVVIPFFVPSLMGLAQKFNWWPSKTLKIKEDENKA